MPTQPHSATNHAPPTPVPPHPHSHEKQLTFSTSDGVLHTPVIEAAAELLGAGAGAVRVRAAGGAVVHAGGPGATV
jgi:hypothetical protein